MAVVHLGLIDLQNQLAAVLVALPCPDSRSVDTSPQGARNVEPPQGARLKMWEVETAA